jgi:hypothetical protein
MASIQPAAQTLGQHLDAVLTAAGHDVKIAAADVESYGSQAWTWIKTNAVHIAGYSSIVLAIKKLI